MQYNNEYTREHLIQINKSECTKGLEGKRFIVSEILNKQPKITLADVIKEMHAGFAKIDTEIHAIKKYVGME